MFRIARVPPLRLAGKITLARIKSDSTFTRRVTSFGGTVGQQTVVWGSHSAAFRQRSFWPRTDDHEPQHKRQFSEENRKGDRIDNSHVLRNQNARKADDDVSNAVDQEPNSEKAGEKA